MHMIRNTRLFILCFPLWLIASCSTPNKATKGAQPTAGNISSLRYAGQFVFPYNMKFRNTTVGGLSGIDYDAASNLYYIICDDRSDINPARFYTADITFSVKGIDTIKLLSVRSLLQANGNAYPNTKQDPVHTPDPEAIRYNPVTKKLVWSSEGERIVKRGDTVLADPSINVIARDGKYIGGFPIPGNLHMRAVEKGPRRNGVFEGLSFADNYKTLFVSVEEPLYEDGPRADVVENDAVIRILKYDVATKKNTAQYAYKLDPVAHRPVPPTEFKINGVPDILSIGNNKLLVIERSFSKGRPASTIKVFLADLENATDVGSIASLKDDKHFTPANKKLLVNMDDLGFYIDNIEGMTFGPILPNGHKSLLFIADNNFDPGEVAQVFLFEVEP